MPKDYHFFTLITFYQYFNLCNEVSMVPGMCQEISPSINTDGHDYR